MTTVATSKKVGFATHKRNFFSKLMSTIKNQVLMTEKLHNKKYETFSK